MIEDILRSLGVDEHWLRENETTIYVVGYITTFAVLCCGLAAFAYFGLQLTETVP